jgi:outer membrane protein assembly factor BamB
MNVLTNRFDNARRGVNSSEKILNPSNISVQNFGKLFTRTVDGDLYAQPLVVDVEIHGVSRSVMILATSRNWIYAYDAVDADAILPLWQHNLGRPVPRDWILQGYLNFSAEVGITSTPVIEVDENGGGTLYVVAKTVTIQDGVKIFKYEIHARDVLTGLPRATAAMREISASVQNTSGTRLTFDPLIQLNRPGLLLEEGMLYLAFGSHSDTGTYFGWVMCYEASTLKQMAVLNVSPDWGQGGIWQSGTGLASDTDGFIYVVVGNGKSSDDNEAATPPIPTPTSIEAPVYGNAVLKLKLDRTGDTAVLRIADWFTASDTMALNSIDSDFMGGPVVFDAPIAGGPTRKKLVLGAGKDGKFYLLDRENLGHWVPLNNRQILQADKLCTYHIHGAPIVWEDSDQKINAFVWSEKDYLKKLSFEGFKFLARPSSTSVYGLPQDELRMPGGMLALSWDGKNNHSAVVWASHPTDDDAMNKTVNGTLRAFDAQDLNRELWNSDMDAQGVDRVGSFAKFCPPVVSDGRVYLSTFSREVAVYGVFAENGKPSRQDEAGIFELRGIGPDVQQSASYSCARYDLRVSGRGIAGVQDSFLFAHVERDSMEDALIGISARIDGINASQYPNARVGVMIRKFDDQGDMSPRRFAAVVATPQKQVLFLHRDSEAGMVMQDGPLDIVLPCFVRVTASRCEIDGYLDITADYSDGTDWHPLNSKTRIPLDGRLMVGLVATAQTGEKSGADILEAHASFSKIEVTPAECAVTVD